MAEKDREGEMTDRWAISDLVVRYALAVDDGDLETVVGSFAPDGVFTRSGARTAGHADLRSFFTERNGHYAMTIHTVHSLLVDFGDDPARATGLQTGSALLAIGGTMMQAHYRYGDEYIRLDGRWAFASRDLRFQYAVPARELDSAAADALRVRWPGAVPAPADL